MARSKAKASGITKGGKKKDTPDEYDFDDDFIDDSVIDLDDLHDGGYDTSNDGRDDDLSAYYDGDARGASDWQWSASTSNKANARAKATIRGRNQGPGTGKDKIGSSSSSSSSTTPKSRFGPAPTSSSSSNYRNDFNTGGRISDDESEQFFDAPEYDYFDSDENEPPQAKRRL